MYTSTETILVPIDFSEQSMIALEQSYNIARYIKARITLLHVITGKLKAESENLIEKDTLDDLTDRLNNISNSVTEKSDIECSFLIETGRIVPAIIETAKNIDARYIFIGSRKESIGPISMRLIKEAPCPVVSIKGKHHREGCKRIILPLDLTKDTTKKVEITAKLAQHFNAEIDVISAMQPNQEFKLTKLNLLINQVADYFKNKEITCNTKILNTGTKMDQITNNLLDYADDIKGDLIVIMIQQENQIKELIIGSLARKLIMSSNIPVLCLRPDIRETKDDIEL